MGDIMKNVLSFKFGKGKIPFWEIFLVLFILYMFIICLFLGIGIISRGNNSVNVTKEDVDVSVLSIITDFNKIPEEFYNEESTDGITNRDKYNKNYKKYISSNKNDLVFDNMRIDYFNGIGPSIYKINFNKNNWFLFNSLEKNLSQSNIYVVDTLMNFHKLDVDIENIAKDYTENEGYKKISLGSFNFYYSSEKDHFYGYVFIDSDSEKNYYFTISGVNYGLSYQSYIKFFDAINRNVEITVNSGYNDIGISLGKKYTDLKVSSNFKMDLNTYFYINYINNGLKHSNNEISIIEKSDINNNYTITYVDKDILEFTKPTKKYGYLPYTYNDKNIYLKYNIKDYPEFNYSLGAFDGVVFGDSEGSIYIDFNETIEFDSQEVLEKELTDKLGILLK